MFEIKDLKYEPELFELELNYVNEKINSAKGGYKFLMVHTITTNKNFKWYLDLIKKANKKLN